MNDFAYIRSAERNKHGITIAFAILLGVFFLAGVALTLIYCFKLKKSSQSSRSHDET